MTEIIDNGTAPEFYIDDVAFVDDLGETVRVAYFTHARNLAGVFERVVVVKLVRPKSSIAATGKIKRLLDTASMK